MAILDSMDICISDCFTLSTTSSLSPSLPLYLFLPILEANEAKLIHQFISSLRSPSIAGKTLLPRGKVCIENVTRLMFPAKCLSLRPSYIVLEVTSSISTAIIFSTQQDRDNEDYPQNGSIKCPKSHPLFKIRSARILHEYLQHGGRSMDS